VAHDLRLVVAGDLRGFSKVTVRVGGGSVGHGHILSQKSGNKKVFLHIFNLFFLIKRLDMMQIHSMGKTAVSR
jgi:hypothetical protein